MLFDYRKCMKSYVSSLEIVKEIYDKNFWSILQNEHSLRELYVSIFISLHIHMHTGWFINIGDIKSP